MKEELEEVMRVSERNTKSKAAIIWQRDECFQRQ